MQANNSPYFSQETWATHILPAISVVDLRSHDLRHSTDCFCYQDSDDSEKKQVVVYLTKPLLTIMLFTHCPYAHPIALGAMKVILDLGVTPDLSPYCV